MAEVCGNRTHPGYLIPHTGFEDQETHQRLSTPIIRCRRDYISSAASLQVFHHRQTSKPASCRSARRKYSIRNSTLNYTVSLAAINLLVILQESTNSVIPNSAATPQAACLLSNKRKVPAMIAADRGYEITTLRVLFSSLKR